MARPDCLYCLGQLFETVISPSRNPLRIGRKHRFPWAPPSMACRLSARGHQLISRWLGPHGAAAPRRHFLFFRAALRRPVQLLAELLLFPVAHFFGQVAALSSGPPSAWPLRPLPLPRQLWRFEFPFDSSGLLDLRLPWIWRSASSSTAVWLLWVVLPLRRLSSRAAAPPWVATGLASWARLFVGCLELYPLSPWQPA